MAMAKFSALAGLLKGAAKAGNSLLTNKGTLAGTVGALAAAEALKQGIFTPSLNAVGIGRKAPAAAPAGGVPPGGLAPMNMQEYVMYGSPGKSGLFGSSHPLLGGQEAQKGLIEQRFNADNQFRNAQLQASLKSQEMSTGSDIKRQQLVSAAQTILGSQQAERDMYSAKQNTLSNMSANMAVMVAGAGINVPTNYGQGMVTNTQALATTTASPTPLPGQRPQRRYGRYRGRGRGRAMGMTPMYGGGYGQMTGMTGGMY
jgi:hypothetical protein